MVPDLSVQISSTGFASLATQSLQVHPHRASTVLPEKDLLAALNVADVVVDVSNSPSFEDKAVMEFFQTSTGNLLKAETYANVKHHVALSIVGAERLPASGYLRAKISTGRSD